MRDDFVSVQRYHGFIDAIRDANLCLCEDGIIWKSLDSDLSLAHLKNAFQISDAMICDTEDICLKAIDYNIKFFGEAASLPLICLQDTGSSQLDPYDIPKRRLTKDFGKAISHAFLALKKDGHAEGTTISYKIIH